LDRGLALRVAICNTLFLGRLHELAYFGFDSIEGQSETITMVVCDFLFRVLIGEWEKRVYLLKGLGDDKLKHDLYELVVAIP
jgi:hypothetical protein